MPAPNAPEPEQLEFTAQDHATACVVWALIAESFDTNEASLNNATQQVSFATSSPPKHTALSLTTTFINGGGTDLQLALEELERHLLPQPYDDIVAFVRSILTTSLTMDIEATLDDIIAFVQSSMALDLSPIRPKFWHHAMKDSAHKSCWIEAMFKHLDSCYAIGTFRPPQIPPANVTVLPAVIVLKVVINAVKQINAHKVRVCVHGSHQEQGRDFEESFAHTVHGQSIKICVAIACYLAWLIFHFDIHNAFQTCPDNSPESEHTWLRINQSIKICVAKACYLAWLIFHFEIHNAFQTCPDNSPESKHTWLRINQTWLDFYHECFPKKWAGIQELLNKGYQPEQFAVKMFMFVQGCTDASCRWGEFIESFILDILGLVPNRADPCTYLGTYNNQPVILCQATKDFPLTCKDKSTYDCMIIKFHKKWTVHALDKVKVFFGIRFICSDQCVTLDQTHKIKDIIINVFGLSHDKQSGSKGCSTPMIAGTENANDLAACTPYTPTELAMAQKKKFAFGYQHVLGGCMHCALWTRLDILRACHVLAQYQASPGILHFCALKHRMGYLRLHPDILLTFNCSTIPKDISSINFSILDPPLAAQVNLLLLKIVPARANLLHDSNPGSFTSCDNFFLIHKAPIGKRSPLSEGAIPTSSQQQKDVAINTIKGEISQISPPISHNRMPGRRKPPRRYN
jgi:hypothetical protein